MNADSFSDSKVKPESDNFGLYYIFCVDISTDRNEIKNLFNRKKVNRNIIADGSDCDYVMYT